MPPTARGGPRNDMDRFGFGTGAIALARARIMGDFFLAISVTCNLVLVTSWGGYITISITVTPVI